MPVRHYRAVAPKANNSPCPSGSAIDFAFLIGLSAQAVLFKK